MKNGTHRLKQVLCNFRSGEIYLADVPSPAPAPGHLLIRSSHSAVSVGTERMLVSFGKANLLDKARQQPERVREVLNKIWSDGLLATIEAVKAKLEMPIPLGYSNAGVVIAVGDGVTGYVPGQRVASNGCHAEVVSVPVNLCVPVPDGVDSVSAAFTTLAAIALQGIRLVDPTIGETVAVFGLGLIGLFAVQILRANGCRVLAIDLASERVALSRKYGAETVDLGKGDNLAQAAKAFSRGVGVDAVIIAATTESDDLIQQAAEICRKRGRIVLVGVAGLNLSRKAFYDKELSFQVSCSYGPGRYDGDYELKGHDYPVGFVRWTEQRNFLAVLDLMAAGRIEVESLISHRFRFEQIDECYGVITQRAGALGIVLEYPEATLDLATDRVRQRPRAATTVGKPAIGVIGAGQHALRHLLPAFKKAGADLVSVASRNGVGAAIAGSKFGFASVTSSPEEVIADPRVDTIVIATRHDSHARYVAAALNAGKHVFVEKPLALTKQELREIAAAYAGAGDRAPVLMVGFNRRFAPTFVKMRQLLAQVRAPRAITMTVNAGAVPADHWTLDPQVGGGRLIGEGCHFVDLMFNLVDAPLERFSGAALKEAAGDTASITFRFVDGSIGTLHYFTNGNATVAKERIEVFAAGRVLQLNNFRLLSGAGWPGFRRTVGFIQDKEINASAEAFVQAVRSGDASAIPFDGYLRSSEATINVAQYLAKPDATLAVEAAQ